MLLCFIDFREEVVNRRLKFKLNKARDRAHILVGLAIAVSNIDEIIKLIRSSKSPAEAREDLMDREWPAKDVTPLIKLIDDPRHGITRQRKLFIHRRTSKSNFRATITKTNCNGN